MGGEFGPRCAEVRAGLGPDPSAGRLVPTNVQAGRSSRADKDQDRQNLGFSGTPLWKLRQQHKKAAEEALARSAASPNTTPPEGFVPSEGSFYWSEKRQVFWQLGTGQFFVRDKLSGGLAELYEGAPCGVAVAAGAACQDGPRSARHVLVRDLAKASQALRMPIDHIDRPCALFALYEGRGGPSCADFCAKHMHERLLQRLSEFRGRWCADRLTAAFRGSLEAISADFLEKHPGAQDRCAMAMALVAGDRVVLANVGDAACVVCSSPATPSAAGRGSDGSASGDGAGSAGTLLEVQGPERWHLGDAPLAAMPRPGVVAPSPAKARDPHIAVLDLAPSHRGLALLSRAALDGASGAEAAAALLRRCAERPRLGARALADGAPNGSGAAAVVVLLGVGTGDRAASSSSSAAAAAAAAGSGLAGDSAPPPAKRARAGGAGSSAASAGAGEAPTQVRLRHVLLKHKDCKNPIDKVRGGRRVTRSRIEAERSLRKVLEECEGDPKRRSAAFGQRCRELSECSSCLKGGDLSGDLGWLARGKMGASFDEAAFGLRVGQLSDLVDSDLGIHVLWRTA